MAQNITLSEPSALSRENVADSHILNVNPVPASIEKGGQAAV